MVYVAPVDSLSFGKLPPYRPRTFLAPEQTLASWHDIQPLFDRLEAKLHQVTAPTEMEKFLKAWSELNAALEEESTRRYIAMTCNTEDKKAEEAYLEFIEQIEPQIKPRQFKLTKEFIGHSATAGLPKPRYEVLMRDAAVKVELFRPENVPLETEEAKLSQEYQKIVGSLTVHFEGREQTLVRMEKYQERVERALRKQAWELTTNRRFAEAATFDRLYAQLIQLRHQIGLNAGFKDYQDYTFRKLHRFDYTPADCEAFHEAVEHEVMPVVLRLQAQRRENLRLDTLRPWDLSTDQLGREPLKPFENAQDMISRAQRIFDKLDSELSQGFRQMDQLRLLDLSNRKHKAPGGYQSTLTEARLPFIFMNAVGLHRDVETILHEAGHAFHALATREEDLHAYRSPPIEFCEVASMSMELLAGEFLGEFYNPAEAARANRASLEGIITVLPWICIVDAFQSWVYTHPQHSGEERSAAWLRLMNRFGGEVDWSGYEHIRATLWHRQLHIFTDPFYYIEYGIAQLGALQVWANALRNGRAAALRQYKAGLALGASRPLPELFAAAGCRFKFDKPTLASLMQVVSNQLDKLPSTPSPS